jgi:hypothetical protein
MCTGVRKRETIAIGGNGAGRVRLSPQIEIETRGYRVQNLLESIEEVEQHRKPSIPLKNILVFGRIF